MATNATTEDAAAVAPDPEDLLEGFAVVETPPAQNFVFGASGPSSAPQLHGLTKAVISAAAFTSAVTSRGPLAGGSRQTSASQALPSPPRSPAAGPVTPAGGGGGGGAARSPDGDGSSAKVDPAMMATVPVPAPPPSQPVHTTANTATAKSSRYPHGGNTNATATQPARLRRPVSASAAAAAAARRAVVALSAASLLVVAGALWAAFTISRLKAELRTAREQLTSLGSDLSEAREQCVLVSQLRELRTGELPTPAARRDGCTIC
ncbi:hypothetical protein VOLCADRAFT_93036 [Volvox carteri f. nagariensis]|uniref:Uncharacterized protein n=1 Tax=Volvox carteri f. nagariensis TaxID=3068 RepID=D8U164_VOLCA|nr:uncharacterized protein VOLCADRAFT_93036 [Volvox carteri f. nagariensis]EFJ46578.1 hypothetical protein VOLCADRAFT_93036 [Volvox carteri f. nagariensis]|eukprot:XP_002952435.1 hypothetical protein VOLCADRAFT_93036 [Volvox carteri f. nagariensis]